MATIDLKTVTKSYGGAPAVRGVDLAVADREFVVLLGPSGCGKSTTLRMIAGLEEVTGGEIRIGDRVVNELEPKDRDIAMVFQSYGLYPNLSVYENIRFPLRVRKTPKADHEARVRRAAEMVGLSAYLDRRPAALSGGQRQRVALARAVVREPTVFLMDEPLSNLDAKLRVSTRTEIKQLQRRLQTTTIYVTHDQIEALTLADRVVVMEGGEVQQIGPPMEIYDRPANTFVAGFIGAPAMNLIPGTLTGGRFEAPGLDLPGLSGPDGAVTMGIRAEDMHLAGDGESAHLTGPLHSLDLLGDCALACLHAGDTPVHVKVPKTFQAEEGTPLRVALPTGAISLFDPATGGRIPP